MRLSLPKKKAEKLSNMRYCDIAGYCPDSKVPIPIHEVMNVTSTNTMQKQGNKLFTMASELNL